MTGRTSTGIVDRMSQTPAQRETSQLLREIDDRGRGLSSDEIDFVAGLIDGDIANFTTGQMNRIRAMHRNRVNSEDDEDEL